MAIVITMIKRDAVMARLVELAEEWRQAANGRPITAIRASVGLMFLDFAGLLEIPQEEAEKMLNIQTMEEIK